MWLHMPTESHQPEEEKEPDKDKFQSSLKDRLAVHVIPTGACEMVGIYGRQAGLVLRIIRNIPFYQHIHHRPKCKRIENEQLIG